jgi:hypothetical protein
MGETPLLLLVSHQSTHRDHKSRTESVVVPELRMASFDAALNEIDIA